MSKYRSRKFGIAVFFTITTTIALFTGHLSGGEFISAVGLILGLYSAADVMEGKNNV